MIGGGLSTTRKGIKRGLNSFLRGRREFPWWLSVQERKRRFGVAKEMIDSGWKVEEGLVEWVFKKERTRGERR